MYLQLAVTMAQTRTVCFPVTVLGTVTLQVAVPIWNTLVKASLTRILVMMIANILEGRSARLVGFNTKFA